MDAEIINVRIGQHSADGAGDSANAQLEGAAAANIGENIACNLLFHFACRLRIEGVHGKVAALHHQIHLA